MLDFWFFFWGLNLILWLACGVVTALKAKWGVLALGLILPLWYFSAVRLGKPNSPWAKRFYGPEKMRRAASRYEGLLTQHELERLHI